MTFFSQADGSVVIWHSLGVLAGRGFLQKGRSDGGNRGQKEEETEETNNHFASNFYSIFLPH